MAQTKEHTTKLNEGIRVQEAVSCLLCESQGVILYQNQRDRLFGAPGYWKLMQCPKCHLVWLNPRPLPEEIGKLYANYYTHDILDQPPKLARLRRIVRNAILATHLGYDNLANSVLQKGLGRILSLIGPIKEMVELGVMTLDGRRKGKLLDIGCGSGGFLAKMRDLGWEVIGVEPDGQAVKVAREHFGLSVYEGTLEEISFPDNAFDTITMNHVIEHVPNPIDTLQECCRLLKPGGKLVVVTPNIESLGHRLFGEAWRGLEVPRHLYLFPSRSLRACTEQAGLRVLKLWTTARSVRWMWAASRLIRRNGVLSGGSPKKQGLWLRLEGLMFQMVEHGLGRVIDASEELVLIATK